MEWWIKKAWHSLDRRLRCRSFMANTLSLLFCFVDSSFLILLYSNSLISQLAIKQSYKKISETNFKPRCLISFYHVGVSGAGLLWTKPPLSCSVFPGPSCSGNHPESLVLGPLTQVFRTYSILFYLNSLIRKHAFKQRYKNYVCWTLAQGVADDDTQLFHQWLGTAQTWNLHPYWETMYSRKLNRRNTFRADLEEESDKL